MPRKDSKAERARIRERLNAEFTEERQKLRQRCEARKAKIRALARRERDVVYLAPAVFAALGLRPQTAATLLPIP